jgi:hypothetical protein
MGARSVLVIEPCILRKTKEYERFNCQDRNRGLGFVLRQLFLCASEWIKPNLLDKTGVNLIRYLFSQVIITKVLAGLITDLHHYDYSNNR